MAMTNPMLRSAGLVLGVAIVAGTLLAFAFRAPGDRSAILVSAVLAAVVQLTVFAIGRRLGTNVVARIGVGMLMRFFVLVAYGLLAVYAFDIAIAPALISLFVFFFVTTLVEPLLIK
jgi:hypothetical protein